MVDCQVENFLQNFQSDSRGRLSLRILFKPFFNPTAWVVFDIQPRFLIIFFASDYVVKISALPNVFAVFFVAKTFESWYKLWYFWVCVIFFFERVITFKVAFFGRYSNKQMNVIWHNYEFVDRNIFVKRVQFIYIFFCNFSIL